MKIIISQRQQPMHDLDRNHCSSFLLQHQRTSRNLDYQWPAAEKRKDIRRSTSGGEEGDPISLTPSSPHPAVLHMALSHPSNSSILPLPRISFKPPSMSFSSPKTKLQTSAPLSLNSKIEEKLYPPSPASSLCLGIITSSNGGGERFLTAAMHDMVRNHGSSFCWSCFPGIDCWQGKEDPDTSSFSS